MDIGKGRELGAVSFAYMDIGLNLLLQFRHSRRPWRV